MIAEVCIPMRLVSLTNAREHWAIRHRRCSAERDISGLLLRSQLRGQRLPQALRVTITRIGKRRLDGDNLQAAAKSLRDGIADALGIDDGSDRLDWVYRQELGTSYSVRVQVEALSQD